MVYRRSSRRKAVSTFLQWESSLHEFDLRTHRILNFSLTEYLFCSIYDSCVFWNPCFLRLIYWIPRRKWFIRWGSRRTSCASQSAFNSRTTCRRQRWSCCPGWFRLGCWCSRCPASFATAGSQAESKESIFPSRFGTVRPNESKVSSCRQRHRRRSVSSAC